MFHKDYTRREIILTALAAPAILYGLYKFKDPILRTFSRPGSDIRFTTGLDFAAYNQSYFVKGTKYESIVTWSSNTTVTDLVNWSNSRFASAITFIPYIGEHSTKSINSKLEPILGQAKSFIDDLSTRLSNATPKQELIIRLTLNPSHYSSKLLEEAEGKDGYKSGIGYLIDVAVSEAIRARNKADSKKRNLSIEIDAHASISLGEYEKRLDEVLAIKKRFTGSDMPIIASIEDSLFYDKESKTFNDEFLNLFSKADAAMITLSPDSWHAQNPEYSALEEKIRYAKRYADAENKTQKNPKEKKFFVRLKLAKYFPGVKDEDTDLKHVSMDELERALRVIKANADGSFLDDTTGLLLYKGLTLTTDVPFDRWKLKETAEKMYKEFRGLR